MAAKGSAPFSAIYVADAAPGYADATQKRLAARGITATALTGEAEHTARAIVRRLDKKALHFAFLDPFKLDPLPFTVLEEFAKLAHVDILINFATADLQRICGSMPAIRAGPLDRVAPGWREKVNLNERGHSVRAAFSRPLVRADRALGIAGFRRRTDHGLARSTALLARHGRAQRYDGRYKSNSRHGKLL